MKNLISLLLSIAFLLAVTTLTIVYSGGYRIRNDNNSSETNSESLFTKTGILAVRSVPDGAKVFLDNSDVAITATDDTITSLKPGTYTVRVEKEGFETWTKTLDVYSELVTDITAVLVLRSPRLEPVTNYDVDKFSISNDTNRIAYTSRTNPKPGLWMINLNYSPISVFKSNSTILAEDNLNYSPSLADNITWTADDDNIILQLNNQAFLVYPSSNTIIADNQTPKIYTATEVEKLKSNTAKAWNETFIDNRVEIIESQSAPEYILNQTKNDNNIWSPDFYKFLYLRQNAENTYNVVIYNSDEPLPIGEKRIYDNIYISSDTKVYWYSDSYHLILVEPQGNNYYKISLVRIDGTNKTTIYNGVLASDQVYSTPSGDKIIVLTNLKEGSNKNLYTIAIR